VIVSGIVFVAGCSAACAAAGYIVGFMAEPKAVPGKYESSKTN